MKVERVDGNTVITISDSEVIERKAYPLRNSFWFKLKDFMSIETNTLIEARECPNEKNNNDNDALSFLTFDGYDTREHWW